MLSFHFSNNLVASILKSLIATHKLSSNDKKGKNVLNI